MPRIDYLPFTNDDRDLNQVIRLLKDQAKKVIEENGQTLGPIIGTVAPMGAIQYGTMDGTMPTKEWPNQIRRLVGMNGATSYAFMCEAVGSLAEKPEDGSAVPSDDLYNEIILCAVDRFGAVKVRERALITWTTMGRRVGEWEEDLSIKPALATW